MTTSVAAITAGIDTNNAAYTRLRGGWLWAARLAWAAGFTALAAMYVLGFFAVHDVLSTVCEDEFCTLRQQIRRTSAGDRGLRLAGAAYRLCQPAPHRSGRGA